MFWPQPPHLLERLACESLDSWQAVKSDETMCHARNRHGTAVGTCSYASSYANLVSAHAQISHERKRLRI